jgi:hypothetical protein
VVGASINVKDLRGFWFHNQEFGEGHLQVGGAHYAENNKANSKHQAISTKISLIVS